MYLESRALEEGANRWQRKTGEYPVFPPPKWNETKIQNATINQIKRTAFIIRTIPKGMLQPEILRGKEKQNPEKLIKSVHQGK